MQLMAWRDISDLLQKTFNSMTDAIFILDAEVPPRIVECNEAASIIFGYEKAEMLGKTTAFLHVSDETLKRFQSLLYPAVEKGQLYFHLPEFQMRRKDGSVFASEHSVAQLSSNEGKRIGWVSIVKDITERKKTEKKLRESEEKYRNLFENARDLILTVDLEGNITSANSALLEYGYDKNEVLGKNLFDFVPKKYWQQFRDGFRELAHGKPSGGEFKVDCDLKRQGYIIAEYKSNPIIKDNKVVGVQTIVRDITERKEMEEKLRQYSEHLEELVQKRTEELLESEKKYSVLVEEASDGVAILRDGKIVFANKRATEILGYPSDELIGLSIEKPVAEKYRQLVKERYQQRLRGETPPSIYEVEAMTKTGECVPIELSSRRINYQGRPSVLVIFRDASERKQMEEQRLKLEKLATISELATMVGHDLRNPLQSIENAIYYLQNECAQNLSVPISPKTKEMMQIISDSVNYADKIIRDLQDFSAKKTLTLHETDINAIVKETLSQVKAENVKLITELGCLPEIKVDKDQIKRVFLNLITNGIQAMENGGTLTVSTKKTEGLVEVSFKDTGVGISKENMEKIFSPFFTTRAKGIGMGLPICKKFVENHGGSIEVESKADKGTTFTVKLPIIKKTEVKLVAKGQS